MSDYINLHDFATRMGIPDDKIDPGLYQCGSCRSMLPAWALAVQDDESTPDINEAICGHCITDLQRVAAMALETIAAGKLERDSPWTTDLAAYVKAERNRKINEAMWAVDRDTSPLSAECQEAWRNYVRALNRLTVDWPSPTLVEWPSQPELVYAKGDTA